jgi:hypothetical protein
MVFHLLSTIAGVSEFLPATGELYSLCFSKVKRKRAVMDFDRAEALS